MRMRLWIPLPGPFAITSGRRRRIQRQPLGPYGWVFVVVFTIVTVSTVHTGAQAFLWGLVGGVAATVLLRVAVARHLGRVAARHGVRPERARLDGRPESDRARQRRLQRRADEWARDHRLVDDDVSPR